MNITLTNIPKKGKRTASRVLDGEAMVFLTGKGEVRILNKVGTAVWELVDAKRSVSDIVEEIAKHYEADKSVIEQDVKEFLSALHGAEVVEFA